MHTTINTHHTIHDLNQTTRQSIIDECNQSLADLMHLQSMARQSHWNVKGPNFLSLHSLFEDLDSDLGGHIDTIAERAVQLGGVARGRIHDVLWASVLDPWPDDLVSGTEHLRHLIDRLSIVGTQHRIAIDRATDLDDACTADVFTDVARDLDKWLWFLEAHLQAES